MTERFDYSVLHARWSAAAERGWRVPAAFERYGTRIDLSGHPLVGRSFADLPNPFTPLLELWTTGYALDELTDDSMVLRAPAPRAR